MALFLTEMRWKLVISADPGRRVLSITYGCARHKTDGLVVDGVTSFPLTIAGSIRTQAQAVNFLAWIDPSKSSLSYKTTTAPKPNGFLTPAPTQRCYAKYIFYRFYTAPCGAPMGAPHTTPADLEFRYTCYYTLHRFTSLWILRHSIHHY
jgi:hypothetical protein